MSVRTTILDLAMAIYEEAVALVGEGREADALADATLTSLLAKSSLDEARPLRMASAPVRTRHERPLRASA